MTSSVFIYDKQSSLGKEVPNEDEGGSSKAHGGKAATLVFVVDAVQSYLSKFINITRSVNSHLN